MSRLVGTVSRGIRLPIIREGDNIADIVTESIISASQDDKWGFEIHDRDIIGITEAIVARAQGNYATVYDIAEDIKNKFGDNETIGVIFPILSRNRFAICLRGIAMGAKKIVLMLSYPSDEVGNRLFSDEEYKKKITVPLDNVTLLLTYEDYKELFGNSVHPFTGINYVEYYKNIIEDAGAECEIILSNNPSHMYAYTNNILCCDIHTLPDTKRTMSFKEDAIIYGLDEILNSPINNSGYNETYGLLGSNKANEDTVKLFPRDSQYTVDTIQYNIFKKTGKKVEVLIYGDGCFKDPVGGIWEFADPVVAPFYTPGLAGTPNELKIKYLADSMFADLEGTELEEAIKTQIEEKDKNLVGKMASEGTTPRRLTDLIGSLCDLTSGSGDKGTPVIYIQGYFDNYTTE